MIGQSDFLRPAGMPAGPKTNAAPDGEKTRVAGNGEEGRRTARLSRETEAKAAGRDAAEPGEAAAGDVKNGQEAAAEFSALMTPSDTPKEAEEIISEPRRRVALPQMAAQGAEGQAGDALEATELPGADAKPSDAPLSPDGETSAPAPVSAASAGAAPIEGEAPALAGARAADAESSGSAERPGAMAASGSAVVAAKPEARTGDRSPMARIAGGDLSPGDPKLERPADPEPEAQSDSPPDAAPDRPKTPADPVKVAPTAPTALAAGNGPAVDSGFDPLDGLSVATVGQGSDISAPRGGTGATPLLTGAPDPRVAVQISSQIGLAVSRADGDQVEVRLDPPELGRVRLSFTMKDDGVIALVSVDRPEVLDLMRRHGELLQRDLTASGYRNVSLEFTHSDSGGGSERQKGAPPGAGPSDIGAAGSAITVNWGGGADDRLDIRL